MAYDAETPELDEESGYGEGAPEDQQGERDLDSEVRDAVAPALDNAISWNETQDLERADNLDRYLGRPYGNEIDGLSAAMDRTCFDTVQWILPGLLEIFHGSDETGAFDPTSAEEVDGAEQATDLVNHIYTRDNQGFLISASVLQDALVERLGTWMSVWEERDEVSQAHHEGLSAEEALLLLEDPALTLVSVEERLEDTAATAFLNAISGGQQPPPMQVYDLVVRRRKKVRRVNVDAVPASEYGYEPGARSSEHANLHYRVRLLPRADLVALGYDADQIDGIAATAPDTGAERRYNEKTSYSSTPVHESMELIRYAEVYVRADFDDDGAAEWRKVCLAGPAWELLHQEIVDGHPFTPVSPVLLSHQLEGLSVVDLVRELQAIRTDILRQMVDGLFEVNTPTAKVRRNAPRDTWDAVLNRMPGRPIPVNDPSDVTFESPTWQGGQALPFLEFLEREGEKRTGVSATAMGTNPDLLTNQTAAGLNQLMSAAQQKVGLIARIFAECGYKRLFARILKLIVAHQDKPRTLRIRGQFVQMDPSAWNADMDYVPNVGLGTGSKDKVREALAAMLAVQKEAIASGAPIASWKKVYNLLKEMTKASGLPTVEPYFVDPESEEAKALERPPADPMQDPSVMAITAAEKIKADAMLQKARMEDDRERDKLALETWAEAAKHGVTFDLNAVIAMMRAPRDENGNPMEPQAPLMAQPPAPPMPAMPQPGAPQQPAAPAEPYDPALPQGAL